MSVYTALKFEMPVVAYSALHQVRKGITPEVYIQTMKDFHRLLREEMANVNTAWHGFRNDAIARTLQSVRGLLLEYLNTPLKSDSEAIQKILRERIEEYSRNVFPDKPLGMILTTEGRVIYLPQGTSRTLALSGKKYLSELGFGIGRPHREIFESVFLVEGGMNLDIIEHIVRDRIGIYTPVHGKYIGEFDSYAYSAHNLVALEGELGPANTEHEMAVFFSKGGVTYDVFRSALKSKLGAVVDRHKLRHSSLWQRKLGLGSGREFVLRLQGNNSAVLAEAIGALYGSTDAPFLKDALAAGHLLCKEFIRE
ncbi:MAG: hypothetical protein WEB37_12040 [Bacteroidota bacterium]